MPAGVEKRTVNGKVKFRVVEPDGSLVLNKAESPVDGGGHETFEEAARQAKAINANSG